MRININNPTMNDEYMTFEICGTIYKLSEYDEAIKKNQTTLS